MQFKKYLLGSLCIFIVFFPIPLHADINTGILIASKQLPYILYIQIEDKNHMRVNFIPREIMIPIACKKNVLPIKQLNLRSEYPCIKQSVEQFFHFTCDHSIYLHLNRIANDLDLPYQKINFRKLSNVTTYFSNIVDHLHVSTILKYQRYIDSDMSLRDYYDFYHMFKGKKVHISYYFVNELYSGSYTIPMDSYFHKLKESS